MLGLDALLVANEGKALVICPKKEADKVLKAMKKNALARNGREKWISSCIPH